MPVINLFPKQSELLDLCENSPARIIGVGGGRGAAKSSAIDRVALTLALENPGTLIAIVMRNYDQVRRYHIETFLRAWPELENWLHISNSKIVIPSNPPSQIDFSYSESMEDTKRRFRSANYKFIFVDQSEAWMGDELRELMNANRGTRGAKTILSFNLGGIGIQDHANWFGPVRKYNERDNPANYEFIKVNPWDNVVWALDALSDDGFTQENYFDWPEARRFEYFITRTEYGRQLNALDDSTRNRDLLGSWESLEGAFFGRVYDYQATMKAAEVAEGVLRDWDVRWMSTDWGKTHFCSTHWHGKSRLTPSEVKRYLGWDVSIPLTVVTTYRRMIVNEMTSTQVGRLLVERTPSRERDQIKNYFFSPEQFGERDSEHTTADLVGMETSRYGMPRPERADNSRKVGYGLMYTLLNNTRIWATPPELRTPEMMIEAGDTVWIISTECPELLDALPTAMRNPRDLDDVVKGDLSRTDINSDVLDDVRYGLLSMIGTQEKPARVAHAERVKSDWERNKDGMQSYFNELTFRKEEQALANFSISGRRSRR